MEKAAQRRESGGPDFHSGEFSFILSFAMKKRKPAVFSATKAVKANARARVGQPKPARVVESQPREGRRAKYKERLEELDRGEN